MTQKFRLLAEADTPTVIGKAWWNQALVLSKSGDQRRIVLGAIGAYAAFQFLVPAAGGLLSVGDDDTRRERRRALDLQRAHGWSFGVADEAASLTFTGGTPDPAVQAALPRLVEDLAPKNPRWRPAFVPTLFESVQARPTSPTTTEDARASPFIPLSQVLVPIRTPAMSAAETEARWLRQLLGPHTAGRALLIDAPGPESVAFAAALADAFDPVFLFDNWPHPRGVVPAHLTLAAAAALHERFVEGRALRPDDAPPIFVLDSSRLTPYVDHETQFDNRSTARLPTADMLKQGGITQVLLIASRLNPPYESDDVNEDLVAWASAGIDVRATWIPEYFAERTADDANALFRARYVQASSEPPRPSTPAMWRPTPRTTDFSSGTATPKHPRPPGFGEVPVVVDAATGALLGAVLYRSGSWNRTSSSYFGGGG